MVTLFSSFIEKLKIKFQLNKTVINSPSSKIINKGTIHYHISLTPDQLREIFEPKPDLIKESQRLNIHVVEDSSVSDGVHLESRGLEVKAKPPTKEELALIMRVRGRSPYNEISNVKVQKDVNRNITSIQWDEN